MWHRTRMDRFRFEFTLPDIVRHDDCHAYEPTSLGQSKTLRHLRAPTRIALAKIVMAEWDAWLQNPEFEHTPEPVWGRMNRWREENP